MTPERVRTGRVINSAGVGAVGSFARSFANRADFLVEWWIVVDDIIKQVKDFYDEAGVHFSRTRQKTYGSKSSNWRVTDKYLALLKPGQSILDIGCGNGKLLTGMPAGVAYTGTDFSQTLLDEARLLHPEAEFVYGDVTKPSHWEGLTTYDAIFAVALLHHVPTEKLQKYVLTETKKHLKKRGFLYLTVWNLWQERFLQYHLNGYAEVPYNKEWKRYCVTFDVQTLTNLLSDTGWNVKEIFYADAEGKQTDIKSGQNLVAIAE